MTNERVLHTRPLYPNYSVTQAAGKDLQHILINLHVTKLTHCLLFWSNTWTTSIHEPGSFSAWKPTQLTPYPLSLRQFQCMKANPTNTLSFTSFITCYELMPPGPLATGPVLGKQLELVGYSIPWPGCCKWVYFGGQCGVSWWQKVLNQTEKGQLFSCMNKTIQIIDRTNQTFVKADSARELGCIKIIHCPNINFQHLIAVQYCCCEDE